MRTFINFILLSFGAAFIFIAAATLSAPSYGSMDHAHLSQPAQNTPAAPASVYRGSGIIKAWTEDKVTIAHQPVAELHWPAMTMNFSLADYQGERPAPGQQVDFTFSPIDTGYALRSVSLKK